MASITPERHDPVEGLERAVEASRELAADALRLARLEVVDGVRRAVTGAVLFGVSVLLFALAWIGGMIALALGLARVVDPATSVAGVALGHLLLAVGCVLWARRRTAASSRS